jgi:peptidoglycan/LPS O-acetylase OafA/YrhL
MPEPTPPLAHLGDSRYPAKITPLLGLQFFALGWVILNQFRLHLNLHAGDRSGLVFKGYLGAELFFVIGGFLTAHLYVRAREAGTFNYAGFLWSRLARVYPLHLLMIGAMTGLMLLANAFGASFQAGVFGLHGLVSNVLMIQAWGVEPTVSWNFPSWLISAEWFAYIVFPATAWVAFRVWRWPVLSAAGPIALFTVAFELCARRGFLFSDMTAQIGALQTIPAFLLGAGLYRLGREHAMPPGWGRLMAAASAVWIVLTALMRLPDTVIFPAFGTLVFGLADTAKGPLPALSSPLIQYLGRISRAMYLVYLPVDIVYFHAMARIAPHPSTPLAWTIWAGVFPVIVLAGSVAYHLIQQPAEIWLKRRGPSAGPRRRAAAA